MKRYAKQNSVITRACSKCGGDLGESRYGKQRYCKACHAASMRRNRPTHSLLTPEQRHKANARSYAHVYIKRGVIKREPCSKCGAEKAQMHHPDYSKPLEVVWLCRPCHLVLHQEEKLQTALA